jgi:DNA primase
MDPKVAQYKIENFDRPSIMSKLQYNLQNLDPNSKRIANIQVTNVAKYDAKTRKTMDPSIVSLMGTPNEEYAKKYAEIYKAEREKVYSQTGLGKRRKTRKHKRRARKTRRV